MSFQSVDEIINFYRREKNQMTNAAAIGYMILAARRIHLSVNQEEKLENAMRAEMDFCTEDEAEEAYKSAREE